MTDLVLRIRELSDSKLQDCREALVVLRANLPILFHLLPLTTVERAIKNEFEGR